MLRFQSVPLSRGVPCASAMAARLPPIREKEQVDVRSTGRVVAPLAWSIRPCLRSREEPRWPGEAVLSS